MCVSCIMHKIYMGDIYIYQYIGSYILWSFDYIGVFAGGRDLWRYRTEENVYIDAYYYITAHGLPDRVYSRMTVPL